VIIIEHLITMDINISLLIDIVESYRFEAEINELLEIVISFDISGAERRLSEYEVLLYLKLNGEGSKDQISRNGREYVEGCQ
jgi:hypothetical protein